MKRAAVPLLILACAAGGCVQRRIVVTSSPPGALVFLNDVEVGRTPVEAEFTYHGVYDVRVELDGYQPVETSRGTDQPWWEYPPMDLAAEAWPLGPRTSSRWHFVLSRASRSGELSPDRERVLFERAKSFRERTTPSAASDEHASPSAERPFP